jgi:putative methyltransferase (TIGR04325 family)
MSQRPLISDIPSLRSFVALSLAISRKELNVIDFGGACGIHYFFVKVLFGNRVSLRWHVVETPRMGSAAVDMEDGQLKFFDDLEKAKSELGRVDLLFSSGALQCVSQPIPIPHKAH